MPSNAIGALGVPTPTGTAGATKQAGFMGKDDFLKVLVAQMKYQDPTSPTDIEGMTQQMTQFSILEQLTNVNKSSERDSAVGLLGKTVTVNDGATTITGKVEGVNVSGPSPKLTIAGKPGYDPAMVQSVA
jgi:flagellar basal-body rod modification protein FlgD